MPLKVAESEDLETKSSQISCETLIRTFGGVWLSSGVTGCFFNRNH